MNKITFLFIPLLILSACKNKDDDASNYEMEDDLITLTNLDNDLKESSGLLLIDGVLWTHNDSGDDAKIYSIPENAPDIDEKVNLTNALNVDWEDIAQDDTHFYVGDFGNNSGERQDLVIYKAPKSILPEDTDTEAIRFIFSDQSNFDNSANEHNFDCEAMITQGDHIYIFSKNHVDKKTKLYQIPKNPAVHIAQMMDEFNTDGLITGADLDQNSNTLCLLGYNKTGDIYESFVWIFYDFTASNFFDGKSKRVDLPIETQVEGIASKGDGTFLLSSEDENSNSPSLYLFNADKWK